MRLIPKCIAVLILFLCMVSSTNAAEIISQSFPDMEHSWYRYREAVEYLRGKNVIQGYPDGTFRPQDPINRAEFLKLVFKGRNTVKPARRCFSDVNPDAWYAPYVCTAKNRGIIDGYPNGTYQPEKTVNFAEAIKIALNTYGNDVSDGNGEQWFKPYVDALDSKDILAAHSYIPWENLTRERAVDLIWRITRYNDEKVIPRFSTGCGKAKSSPPLSILINGRDRSFLTTIPSSYAVRDPTPLIIAFHGRTNSNEQVRAYYGLDKEMQDAIIVYPSGIEGSSASFSWADPGNTPYTLRDIAFFDSLVKTMTNLYCIDFDQIYVVGHSLGGWFSNSLACVRGDVIRGSISVGGASVMTDCAGPAAAMIVHNPHDRLSPFSGSELNRQQRVEENGCSWKTSDIDSGDLHCTEHLSCVGNNVVQWCPSTHDYDTRGQYYPHNWPTNMAQYIKKFIHTLR